MRTSCAFEESRRNQLRKARARSELLMPTVDANECAASLEGSAEQLRITANSSGAFRLQRFVGGPMQRPEVPDKPQTFAFS